MKRDVIMAKTLMQRDQGSIFIVTLMVFFMVSILSVTLLNIGLMEYKSSQFEKRLLQAQQGADAGIEWGMEAVYAELNQSSNLNADELPAVLNCGDAQLMIGEQGCTAYIGPVVKVRDSDGEPKQCCYELVVTADFNGAKRGLKVEVVYSYSGGDEMIGPDGSLVFLPRSYLDRGRITTYEYHYN